MVTTSPRLELVELEEDQALPEGVVNEGLLILELFATRCIVKSRTTTAPPGSPAEGDSYLIPTGASGAWAGEVGNLAHMVNGAWITRTPLEGFKLEIEDEDAEIVLRGGVWVSSGAGGGTAMTASEAISAAQFVNIHASSGAKIRKANATDDTKPVDGYCQAAIGNGSSGAVQFPGGVISGLSGLTGGTRYYLSTTGGAITATPPSTEGSGNWAQEVGVALSSTTLSFNPKMGHTL